MNRHKKNTGFTLVELLVVVMIGGLLLAGLSRITSAALTQGVDISAQTLLEQKTQSTLRLITDALQTSRGLVLPQQDLYGTSDRDFRKHGGNGAVLAFVISPTLDFNNDLVMDADQDGDGVLDEDPGGDTNFDYAEGIWGIDDDGDGQVDEGWFSNDDDEDGLVDEDPINGADDDNDGRIDEDPGADINGDGEAGIAGYDDDGDGDIDEGSADRDQEDGDANHDWYDTSVFYVESPGILVQRTPVAWDATENGSVTGRDVHIETIVEGISELEFERLAKNTRQADLVRIKLVLIDEKGNTAEAETIAQVGGRL